jgi:Tol biopolymer transport system component
MVALALVAAAALAASPGRIVFDSNRDGDYEIYAVNRDGSGLTQLTRNSVEDSAPLPSPDGSRIAFYSEEGGAAVTDPAGGDRRFLRGCHGAGAADWAWSPDSKRLACASAGSALLAADLERGIVAPLVSEGWAPAWSPDGSTIAFVNHGLWSVPANGGSARRLGRRTTNLQPSWSPDSKRITYAAYVSAGAKSHYELRVIDADGSDDRLVAAPIADDLTPPRWSPDGTRIAFTKPGRGFSESVYVIRPNGRDSRRITVSRGGEASIDPVWTGDGSLLYSRYRYKGSPETDVFLTSGTAPGGLALTSPFPAGGTNGAARWMPGARLETPPRPKPRTTRLRATRALVFAAPQEGLVANGGRAVAYADGSCTGIVVWEPAARRSRRVPRLCDRYSRVAELVISGTRLAWVSYFGSNSGLWEELSTLRLGTRRPTRVSSTLALEQGGGDEIDHLRGDAGRIVFTSRNFDHGETSTVWELVTGRGSRCPWTDEGGLEPGADLCRRLAAAPDSVSSAVDAGRVLTVAPGGIVRVLTFAGQLVRTWTLGPGIADAELEGRTVAVQRGASLAIYDVSTGERRASWPLAANEGSVPRLLDVQGDRAVYATGGAIHVLRLSDGRDRALAIPGAAPPLSAQLEPGGLYVLWNRMYDRRPGRLAFIAG